MTSEGTPDDAVPSLTLRRLRRSLEARLTAAGVDTPELDARLLLQEASGLSRDRLLIDADRPVADAAAARAWALIERRAAREPVSRILGRREFWSLEFALDSSTLDPRPDSETVIETALAAIPDRAAPLRLLDLGTGTGCLLLALLRELPHATGIGLDISPAAVAAAAGNAASLGLADRAVFLAGDWRDGLGPRLSGAVVDGAVFDVVVANPPYIPDAEIAGLQPEVRAFDPHAALAGGADGLDAYRALAPQLAGVLSPGGVVVFEVGAGQAPAVAALLAAAGLAVSGTARDLAGVERCVAGRRATLPVGC